METRDPLILLSTATIVNRRDNLYHAALCVASSIDKAVIFGKAHRREKATEGRLVLLGQKRPY